MGHLLHALFSYKPYLMWTLHFIVPFGAYDHNLHDPKKKFWKKMLFGALVQISKNIIFRFLGV
jgi:hypothetical protein